MAFRHRVRFVNQSHLHLILNHFPTIGLGVRFGLFVRAFVARSDDLRRASLTVLFVIALLALPAYLTGNAAHFVLRDQEAAVSVDNPWEWPICEILDQEREQAAGARMSLNARIVAAGSIVLLVGVVFLGRFLPYLGSE